MDNESHEDKALQEGFRLSARVLELLQGEASSPAIAGVALSLALGRLMARYRPGDETSGWQDYLVIGPPMFEFGHLQERQRMARESEEPGK